jgi:anaerobic magnesium-protoporphyrin IX monomethyl ester cyclase
MKKRTIVLFHPKLNNPKDNRTQVRFAPLGVLHVSSLLLEKGYEVVIIDSNMGETFEDKGIEINDIVCIGISAMTGYQIKDGLFFAEFIRNQNSNIPIVWGGIHVSLMPEQSLENDLVDIVVLGQGEETFCNLVDNIIKEAPLEEVKGIYFRKNGVIIKNNKRPFVAPDKFPPAPYYLLDIPKYFSETEKKELRSSDAFLGKEERFIYYCSSIGCPFRCRFCASSKQTDGRWVGFSAERVLNDIEKLIRDYQITSLQFCDAEFFINKKRALKIAQGFINRKFNIRWKAQVRADTFDSLSDEDILILKNSGYIHVEIGVESGSARMLEYINKKITVDMVIRCAEKIAKHNLLSSFCLVFGFPTETKTDIHETFKLASKLKELLPTTLLPTYFFDPYPGVPLYFDSIEHGMNPPESLEEWSNIKPNMREPSPLVPWIDKKNMDYVHKVIIFYLPLAFPANIGLGTLTNVRDKMGKGKFRYFYRMGNKLAKWRVKHQFFDFPFEWITFKFFNNLKVLQKK